MIWLKKLKTTAIMFAAIGFLFAASLNSCGNKKAGTESSDKPAVENAEHPEGGEHPTEGGDHPADTTGSGEHPDN